MLTPFRCRPVYLEKPWGSGAGLRRLGLPAPESTGEVWLVSDVEGTPTLIEDGPYAGRTLRELVAAEPEAVLGRASGEGDAGGDGPRFPLLVKLLEVAGRLSVQVHPDGPTAQALGKGPRGKSEAWYVLEVGPEGEVGLGLAGPLGADELLAAARAGSLPERMQRFRPAPGDGLEILPGTFHFARQLLFLEVQETCDVTFRVWDWGSERALHLPEAAECLRRIPSPGAGEALRRRGDGELEVAPASPFRFRVLRLQPGERLRADGALPRVVVSLAGQVTLGPGEDGLPLVAGQAAVAPAAAPELAIAAAGAAQVAVAWPHDPQPEPARRLVLRRMTLP